MVLKIWDDPFLRPSSFPHQAEGACGADRTAGKMRTWQVCRPCRMRVCFLPAEISNCHIKHLDSVFLLPNLGKPRYSMSLVSHP